MMKRFVTENYLKTKYNELVQSLKLFWEFAKTYRVSDAEFERHNPERTLLDDSFAKSIDVLTSCLLYGTGVTLMLWCIWNFPFTIKHIVGFGLLSWFLIRLLNIIVKKE